MICANCSGAADVYAKLNAVARNVISMRRHNCTEVGCTCAHQWTDSEPLHGDPPSDGLREMITRFTRPKK